MQNPKVVTNEFTYSTSNINYKVQSFVGQSGNFQANERALMEEESVRNRQLEKEKLKQETISRMKENLKEKKREMKKTESLKEQKSKEKQSNKEKLENYNLQIRMKCLNKKNIASNMPQVENPNQEQITFKGNDNNLILIELNENELNEDKVEQDPWKKENIGDSNFSFKESLNYDNAIDGEKLEKNAIINDIMKEDFVENHYPKPQLPISVKTVNIRDDIESHIKQNKNNYIISNNIKEEDEEPQRLIENNIESLKNFRKNGFFNTNSNNMNYSNNTSVISRNVVEDKINNIYELEKEKTLKLEEEKKFRNELEKRR